jgi:hypothetical protein
MLNARSLKPLFFEDVSTVVGWPFFCKLFLKTINKLSNTERSIEKSKTEVTL